jgi:hypothetical protein
MLTRPVACSLKCSRLYSNTQVRDAFCGAPGFFGGAAASDTEAADNTLALLSERGVPLRFLPEPPILVFTEESDRSMMPPPFRLPVGEPLPSDFFSLKLSSIRSAASCTQRAIIGCSSSRSIAPLAFRSQSSITYLWATEATRGAKRQARRPKGERGVSDGGLSRWMLGMVMHAW